MSEQEKQNEEIKHNFFTKVWYSITKIEKYPDIASEGLRKILSLY